MLRAALGVHVVRSHLVVHRVDFAGVGRKQMTYEMLLSVAVCRQITSLNVMHIACVDHR